MDPIQLLKTLKIPAIIFSILLIALIFIVAYRNFLEMKKLELEISEMKPGSKFLVDLR